MRTKAEIEAQDRSDALWALIALVIYAPILVGAATIFAGPFGFIGSAVIAAFCLNLQFNRFAQ